MAHILVVDDEPGVRALIKEVLAMDGHTSDEAHNGSEALAQVRAGKYDLMILDRSMPVMDGIQALQVLRAGPAPHAALKVIMCTSSSVMKEVEEAFAAGANDYVLKPLNLKLLSEKINKLLL